ncbi:MAG: 50S ribosomal protein L25 [Balneolaceae bacterium]
MKKPEVVKLTGEKRETGASSASKLRRDKRIPAVIYGPKLKENVHLHISELELDKILSKTQTKLQELAVDGKTYKTLLKRVEFDPVTDRAIHVDFYLLDDKQPVTLRVPIRLHGTATGVVDGGGRVFQPMRIVRVRALPSAIPAQFEVDISPLEIGDSIHVSELDMEGISLIDDPSRTIVTISPPKAESVFTTVADEEEVDEEEAVVEGEEVLEEGEEGEEEAEEESTE